MTAMDELEFLTLYIGTKGERRYSPPTLTTTNLVAANAIAAMISSPAMIAFIQ